MTAILPKGNNERIAWSLNFEQEFPDLATALGFDAAEKASLLEDSAAMRFGILLGQTGAAFSKSCTAYKNGMLGGVGENQATPGVPAFTPPTGAPGATVDAGVIERLSNAMNRAKLSPNYTETIGETLMIKNETVSREIPADAKTTVTSTPMTGSIVRLDWTKGIFDGVFIESQRGDEATWTSLDFDMRSPFEDTRPPLVAGKPEERRYRLRYFIDNEAVGAWSDVVVAITLP